MFTGDRRKKRGAERWAPVQQQEQEAKSGLAPFSAIDIDLLVPLCDLSVDHKATCKNAKALQDYFSPQWAVQLLCTKARIAFLSLTLG